MEKKDWIALIKNDPEQFFSKRTKEWQATSYAEELMRYAAEINPIAALEYAGKYIDQPYAANIIKKAAGRDPFAAFEYADKYIDQPYASDIIKQAAEIAPEAALRYADKYKNQSYAAGMIKQAAELVVEAAPSASLLYATQYIDQPYAADIIKKAARLAPNIALEYINLYKDQPYAADIIKIAAEAKPFAALQYTHIYKDQPYAADIIKIAAEKDPEAAFAYVNRYKDQPYAADIINRAAEKYPYIALVAADKYKDQPYAADIINRAAIKAPDSALQYAERYKDQPYAADIIKRAAQKTTLSDKYSCLEIVNNFNRDHDLPNVERFALLSYLGAAQKYNLITLGREEAYTSTYHNLLNSLIDDLKNPARPEYGKPLTSLLSPEQKNNMGSFLEAAASYGRIKDVLDLIPKNELPHIIENLVERSGKEDNLSITTTLATIIQAHPDEPTLRKALEQSLIKSYDAAITDKSARHRYGLLSALYANTYEDKIAPEYKKFFETIKKTRATLCPDLIS